MAVNAAPDGNFTTTLSVDQSTRRGVSPPSTTCRGWWSEDIEGRTLTRSVKNPRTATCRFTAARSAVSELVAWRNASCGVSWNNFL